MTDTDKEFYLQALEHHPDDARRFGWMGERYQKIRFAQILRLVKLACMRAQKDPRDISILDFGCGDAELFSIMDQAGIGLEYYGVDMMSQYIYSAHQRAKNEPWGVNAAFECYEWDGSEPLPFSDGVDIIVESGAFSIMERPLRNRLFQEIYSLPKLGFAGTFLTHNINIARVHPTINPIAPSEITSQIDIHQYAYTLLFDYLPHDFAIGIYPRPVNRPALPPKKE